jgi:phosphate transport system substrate-binding protein
MAGSGNTRRRLALLLLCVICSIASSATVTAPAQASVTVLGAGSTWDQIATTQFAADVHTLYGITINYQGVGSSAGREFYIENQVDFGDSDIPFLGPELARLRTEHKTFQYLPTVAGATGLMYNVRSSSGKLITNLQLDSKVITGIFTGTIHSWRDPRILAENPGLRSQLPSTTIIPVVRADGSGTSAMFSDYLRQMQPAMWRTFCAHYTIPGCGQISFWPLNLPNGVAQKGSDGVANYVQQQTNTITYVETGYALARNFPVVLVKNQSGRYVFPSSANDATALRHARIQSDLISDLSGVHVAPEPNAYPIAGYSYMITPTKVQFGFTAQKGAVLGKFILYMACAGQQKAAQLGYSPLTPVLVRGVFAAVKRIPGAPAPPPISQCANPTITGRGSSGGAQGNPGQQQQQQQSSNGQKKHQKGSKSGSNHGTQGGTGPVTSTGVTPTTGVVLTANQLAARRAVAAKLVADVKPPSNGPLLLAVLDIALIVFCPWLIWHQRRRPPGSQEGG